MRSKLPCEAETSFASADRWRVLSRVRPGGGQVKETQFTLAARTGILFGMNRLSVIACIALTMGNLRAADFRAGSSAVRITPDRPMPMAGYYNIRLSTNTHDELHAKAIVI